MQRRVWLGILEKSLSRWSPVYWEALASVSKLLATALHLPHESPPRGGVCPFIALVEGDVMFCPAAALLPGAL